MVAGRPAVSSADGPRPLDLAAARALFADAERDEQAGRWAGALEKVRRASSVKMTPGLRFHIALCQERLGHLVAALDDYAAAEAAARAEGNREVLDLVTEPEASLKVRTPTITVHLPAQLAGGQGAAEVVLDGATIASSAVGRAVRVDPGSHMVQARAPGQIPYAMSLSVVERQTATIDVHFLPLQGAEPPPPVPSAPKGLAAMDHAHPASAAVPSQRQAPDRSWATVATVAAPVLVAGGVVAFALAGSDQSYWQAQCARQGSGCGTPTPVRAWDAVALGAWIAGAASGVAAVVLWTRPEEAHGVEAHAELRVAPAGLSLSGTF
jgi:hypothetical protein